MTASAEAADVSSIAPTTMAARPIATRPIRSVGVMLTLSRCQRVGRGLPRGDVQPAGMSMGGPSRSWFLPPTRVLALAHGVRDHLSEPHRRTT